MRIEEIRGGLVARLRERLPEIEQATITRVHAISDRAEAKDPVYLEGLRSAVGAAINYALEALGSNEDRPPPIPTVLLSQARLAARSGISLDVVLRRYFAGYTLLGDFLIEEAEGSTPVRDAALKRLLRTQAALFDRVIGVVSEEYGREAVRPGSFEERRADLVRRLLDGELLDAPELEYDFDANHLGLIANGQEGGEEIRRLAAAFDCRFLVVHPDDGTAWAWLSSRRAFDFSGLQDHLSAKRRHPLSLAMGEPGRGLVGWRFTHRQAQAALPIALRCAPMPVRYGEYALLAAALQDSLFGTSLRELYLDPLARERDGGVALRQTLRAYFAASRNGASAASMLAVSRQTVSKRLRTVEQRLGRSLVDCAAEIEVALGLEDFDHFGAFPTT
jgi:hypothetical protein